MRLSSLENDCSDFGVPLNDFMHPLNFPFKPCLVPLQTTREFAVSIYYADEFLVQEVFPHRTRLSELGVPVSAAITNVAKNNVSNSWSFLFFILKDHLERKSTEKLFRALKVYDRAHLRCPVSGSGRV